MPGRVSFIPIVVGLLFAFVAPAWSSNDSYFDRQWGMEIIGAPQAWAKGTGKGIVIATVDSGVDLDHEDLRDQVLQGRGKDYVDNDNTPQDGHGHGTHVAGIAAAATGNGKGVAGVGPGAKILPMRVFDDDGKARESLDTAIRWATDNGAHVINVSAGSLTNALGQDETLFGPDFRGSIEHAWSKGVIVVLSAGNDFLLQSGYADIPAIVVAATDRHDRKPDFSSGVGEARWGMAAPGGASTTDPISGDIYSTYYERGKQNIYHYLRGTSMAAPHVSGAAAVLRGMGLGPQQTVDRLLSTAKDIGPEGRDSTFGHGRLDLAAAAGISDSVSGSSASGASGEAGGGSLQHTAGSTGVGGPAPGGPVGGPSTRDASPSGNGKAPSRDGAIEETAGGAHKGEDTRAFADAGELDETGTSRTSSIVIGVALASSLAAAFGYSRAKRRRHPSDGTRPG